jgi:hypothetical protein
MMDGPQWRLGGAPMDEMDGPNHQPLPHQRSAWDQIELLSAVVGRYVHIQHRHGASWPSWDVQTIEDDDIHEVVVRLNRHLAKLGWLAKLTRARSGWAITVLPLPERQFPRRMSVAMFWFLSALTLTLAADVWAGSVRPASGWFASSTLVDAFVGYALPVLTVLALASALQWAIARRYGVRSGWLLPVPDLTIALYAIGLFPHEWLFWPFGLLLIPSLPRMDARPWPDRAALGYTALSVPLAMGLGGLILFFIGVALTPEYLAPATMPLVTQAPVLMSLLSVELIHADALVRMAWAHPFVHAGGMLMLFAWISLLPIPTFPGGRLLVARMGLLDARSSSTQTLLIVTTFVFAYVFGVFASFSLWYLVLALVLPLLFFFGNALGSPVVLDEVKGLTEPQHRQLGLLLLVVFLFLLPAQQPVVHGTEWADAMSVDVDMPPLADAMADGTWVAKSEVRVTNPSFLAQPFAVDVRYEQRNTDWRSVWDCDGLDALSLDGEGCGDVLLPGRTAVFWVNHTWTGVADPTAANMTYVVELDGIPSLHVRRVAPALEVAPDDHWYDVPSTPPQRCVHLNGELTVSSQLNVSIDGVVMSDLHLEPVQLAEGGLNTTFSTVPDRVCMTGVDPIVLDAASPMLHVNNRSFPVLKPMKEQQLLTLVPASGWTIDPSNRSDWGGLLDQGGVLTRSDTCAINTTMSPPARPAVGPWIWDTSVRHAGHMPAVDAGEQLTLLMLDGSNHSVCSDPFSPYPRLNFDVHEGPEMMITWLNTTTRFLNQPWALSVNGTLLNAGMGVLEFDNPANASVPFRLSREGDFGEDWTHDWNGENLSPGLTRLEFAPPSSGLASMWLTYESNAVVLHLATYS